MWRLKGVFISFLFLIFSQNLFSQNDNVGSGRAISLDGVDDYIDFGDRYSNLVFPFTVSAWIYVRSSSSSSPIFVSRNNNPLYNGFWFMAYENYVFIEYGDGMGGGYPWHRRGKKADVNGLLNRWNHVTAVVKGVANIELYLNGVNVGGYETGESNLPMVSNVAGGHSTAGYLLSNGFTYYSKAIVDDIRLWNRSLSQEEIRQTMCVNLTGNESGLIGYWDFNETSSNIVYDKSPNKFNGQLVGIPSRQFSGAPIGNVSTYSYTTSWTGKTLSLQDNDHKVDVKNIKGSVEGVQLYEVKSVPSQTTGLDLNNSNEPYFGVFLVNQNSDGSFDTEYSYQGDGSCTLFTRENNSKSLWSEVNNPIKDKLQRGEIVKGSGIKYNLDLGTDKIVCDQSSYELSTGITDPQFSCLWNTGQNTSSIVVNQPGTYWVDVIGLCSVVRDSIVIDFKEKPAPVFLGSDKTFCDQPSYQISTGVTDPQFTFLWNTGQNTSSISVNQSGLYSVKVVGLCGVASDTIALNFEEKPIISLGEDKILCDQLSHQISTGITSSQYTIQWNTGQTTSSILVGANGLYSVKVSGHCGIAKDSVAITFKESPKVLLGDDKILCDNTAAVISTGISSPLYTFQWSTGQNTSAISVNESGLYSVKVFGYCGVVKDSITINFEEKPKPISLGEDVGLCVFNAKILQPMNNSNGLTFLWQDGSTNSTFEAKSFGKFWVTVKNFCGQESDSVTFSELRFPTDKIQNVITPNGDNKNDFFIVDNDIKGQVSFLVMNRWGKEVYFSPAYENKWSGGDLPSGVYYIVLEGDCIDKTKSFLNIIR